jgi:hypothetical protein
VNKKKLIGIIGACVVVIVVVVAVALRTPTGNGAPTDNDTGVAFTDPNLEAAIREAVGIPEETIYAEDLQGLTALAADGRNIADLSGLEHCIDLTHISLSHKPISDISPLVDNPGLGEGDGVILVNNPLSEESINVYIPELEARGVTIEY